jgi:hypothetical protein
MEFAFHQVRKARYLREGGDEMEVASTEMEVNPHPPNKKHRINI